MPPLPPPSTRRRSLLALPLLLAGRPLHAQAGEPVRLPRHVRMPDPQLLYVRRIVGLPLVRGSELAQWAQAGSLKRKLPCQVDSRLLESAAVVSLGRNCLGSSPPGGREGAARCRCAASPR